MGVENGNLNGITLAEFARKSGGNYDTLYRKVRRKFPYETWSAVSVLSAEHIRELSGKTGQLKSAASVRHAEKPATVKPGKQPAPATAPAVELLQKKQHLRLPVFGLSELLSVVIYAHTALVWYEVALIFGMPGIFAGVILAALKHSAVVASKNPDYDRFTADTLGVAFVLDALAVYAHYTAFREALPGNFAQQMGNGGSFWAACVLAVVVASGAFISLYFINEIRKTK